METSGPTSGIPQLLNTVTARATALQLQIGQQLQAVVLDNTAGKILLSIGQRQVSAESSLPFSRGQALTVEVRSLGEQPILRVISALQESPVAMAVRLLLPRYGASTPLLANLAELARSPAAPVPALIREAGRILVADLPTPNRVSSGPGLKAAVEQSGLILEHKLLQTTTPQTSAPQASTPLPINADYKANLVRLIQLVRNWPGSSPPSPPTQPPAPATTTQVLAPAGSPPATPGTQTPVVPQPPAAGTPMTLPIASEAGKPTSTTATPDQIQRAIQSGQTPATVRPGTPATPTTATTLPPAPATPASVPATTTAVRLNPPPPFPGVIPIPQAPVQISLDIINRLGGLRLDMLQQAEAALARVQLSQLASLPREAERGLLEWLFDIPVRRDDDIDFWSARFLREQDTRQQNTDDSANWSVQLAFDLPGLGPMQAQIQLHGDRVSTHFWATQTETLPLLREHLHELRSALDAVGLEVGDLDCQAGQIPQSGKPGVDPLINEKA